MAITITGKKEHSVPGLGMVLTGIAAFSTTDTTGVIPVGANRLVKSADFTWIPASTAISEYVPQVVGTPSVGNTNAYIATGSAGSINIIRPGSGSGLSFFFKIIYE